MNSAENVSLKRCPFCGGEGHLSFYSSTTVECLSCDAAMEGLYSTPELAIAAWNLRSPPTEDADRVEVWGSSIIDRLQRAIMDDDEAVRERAAENVAVLYAHSVAPYAAALAMVREAIGELFGPKASIESEDATLLRGPEPHHEAEAQIAALRRVSASPRPETVGVSDRVYDAVNALPRYSPKVGPGLRHSSEPSAEMSSDPDGAWFDRDEVLAALSPQEGE